VNIYNKVKKLSKPKTAYSIKTAKNLNYSKNRASKVKKLNKFKTTYPAKAVKYLNYSRSKASEIKANLDYYAAVDGVYSSYWVGKLISVLVKKGNKKIASKHVYKSFSAAKYITGVSPLIIFLEILDRIKPTFRLRNYIVRRVIIKEYPIVARRSQQLMLATHWFKTEVRSGSVYFGRSFSQEITNKLLEFRSNPKKNNLIKKRAEYTRRTIVAQFNIRYPWR
jgi:ribosomal protein S7